MLTVISPAKALNFDPVDVAATQPRWPDQAASLARTVRGLTLRDWRATMGLSDDLARLNRDRFRAYQDDPAPDAVKPALYAFNGDTYQGFQAATLDASGRDWAQDHLRILSGLYGLLRPTDAIQPYRLEMGSRIHTRRGETLYAFWGDRIAKALNADAAAAGTDLLINCASQEYFGAADHEALKLNVIAPVFLELKGGKAQTVSFFAKRARGAMARFIMDHRLTDPAGVRDFTWGGYAFDPERTMGKKWAFSRSYPTDVAAG
jgi:uncharacterized protein